MDDAGTRAIADSLALGYVYYPSTLHPATGRDFGNAILSRFPISEDRKVVLPHLARIRRTLRTAVGATILVGSRRLRVYSVHLATFVNNGPRARREQFAAILADAEAFPAVVIGGDFNSGSVPEIAVPLGYTWPTQHLGHTASFWSMDHMLFRGVALANASAIGMVRDIHGASDHKPVWARIVLGND
jgi:endonuclease/exonuclease/phosphatase family metal-dependent hydrolase